MVKATKSKQIANIKFLMLSLIFLGAFILVFTLLLRFTERHVQKINPSDYIIQTPANFDYELIVTNEPAAINISGYAIILNEKSLYVDNYIVLYNDEENVYLKAPTSMQFYLDIPVPEDNGAYYYGKFASVVLKEDLKLDLSDYKIGFLYKSNGYNNIILTDVFLQQGEEL